MKMIDLRMFVPLLSKNFLAAGAPEPDVSGSSAYLEHRAATVQISFTGDGFGFSLIPFAGNSDLWKIGMNFVAVSHLDRSSNADVQVGNQIDGYVAGRSFQSGIRAFASGRHEFSYDAAAAGLCPSRGHAVQFDAAATRLCAHRPFG